MIRHCEKVRYFFTSSFIVVLVFVLLNEIAPIKNAVKSIIKFAENYNVLGLKYLDIGQLYIILRKYALYYLALSILSLIIIKIYLWIRDYYNRPKNDVLNPFEESLYKYINNKSGGKAYLVTGEWGSGKTFIVTKFFNKYYKYSSKSIYRISCFGLDSRKLILDEIKNQIEINDNSLFNWTQHIPIIGKPVFGMLKNTYSLNSIPDGSIFIFDDFERITSLGITDNLETKTYKKNKTLFRDHQIRDTKIEEFKDINEEFTKIATAFSEYDRANELIKITDNLQKYNVVTGLITELIENYKVKVIIICNVDILGYNYVDKVFRGKLDCITYNKSIDGNSLESILQTTLKSQIYPNKNIERLIERAASKIIIDFKKIWFSSGNNNLRQVKTVFQAFLDTVSIFSSKVVFNESYLISLFYSIYVVRVLRDENNLSNLDKFLVGGNLIFLLDFYNKKNLFKSLSSSNYLSTLKWTGLSVAGFWILNIKKPDDMDQWVQHYSNYEFNCLELALLDPKSYSWNGDKLLLEHALYAKEKEWMVNSNPEEYGYDDEPIELWEIVNMNFGKQIGYILKDTQCNSVEEQVHSLLLKINYVVGDGYYTPEYFDDLFKSIYKYSKVLSVTNDKNLSVIRDYNEFAQTYINNNKNICNE